MFFKKSISNWEDSFFGGYSKMLYEHPFIIKPKNILVDSPISYELYEYSRYKLIDIFLLKVSKMNLIDIFFNKHSIKKNILYINDKSKKQVLDIILDSTDELISLFDRYKKIILDSTISILLDSKGSEGSEDSKDSEGSEDSKDSEGSEDSKDSEGSEDSKDSEGSEDSESSKDSKDYEYNIEDIKKTFSDIKEYDFSYKNDIEKLSVSFVKKRYKKYAKTHFSDESKITASKLIQTLDIKWDNECDKINNLVSGKLDTNKIACALAYDRHIYHRIEENVITKPFSVAILGDMSGSMASYKIRYQKEILKTLYLTFDAILKPNNLYIYGHTGCNNAEVHIFHEPYDENFENCFDKQYDSVPLKENYDGPVIEKIYQRIRKTNNSNILFISLSDGHPAGTRYGGKEAYDNMKRILEKMLRDGFITVGIGILYSSIKNLYKYQVDVTNIKELPSLASSVINKAIKTEFQHYLI